MQDQPSDLPDEAPPRKGGRKRPYGMHVVGAVVMILAAVAGMMFFRNKYEQSQRRAAEMAGWVPDWDPKEFHALAGQVETNYAATGLALSQHDLAKARSLTLERDRLQFKAWVEHHAEKTLAPDLTVRTWYDSLEARYLGAVMREYEYLAAEVRAGRRPMPDLEDFVSWNTSFIGLQMRLEEDRRDIEAAAPAAK